MSSHAAQERLGDEREVGVAPDHLRLDPLEAAVGDAKGARLGAHHEIAAHRDGDPLDLDRRLRLDIEDAAHVPIGFVADPESAGRGRLLHARGDVDRDAANASLRVDAAAEQHRAGVDADTQGEPVEVVALTEICSERRGLRDDCQPGADGALRIVLERLVGSEHCEQAVAGVLEDAALVGTDD